MSSDWPVCSVSETAAPHRMGAALTYARRYALFTLVGIAGEDELDAPDLNGGMDAPARPNGLTGSGQEAIGVGTRLDPPAAAFDNGRRKQIKPASVVLPTDHSLALREKLISELKGLAGSDALTMWAQRILALKNQLTTADAKEIEDAFAAKLEALAENATSTPDALEASASAETNSNSIPTTANGNGRLDRGPISPIEKPKPGRKLNRNGAPKHGAAHQSASVVNATDQTIGQQVTPLTKPFRLRDRDHLKFVSTQPCLACGRSPSDAHHLKFAEGRALGRKVSDEFTVPLCRAHHLRRRKAAKRAPVLLWALRRLDSICRSEVM
jgi:hypothetical protein